MGIKEKKEVYARKEKRRTRNKKAIEFAATTRLENGTTRIGWWVVGSYQQHSTMTAEQHLHDIPTRR